MVGSSRIRSGSGGRVRIKSGDHKIWVVVEFERISSAVFIFSSPPWLVEKRANMGGDGGSIPNRYDLVEMHVKFRKRQQAVDKTDAEARSGKHT